MKDSKLLGLLLALSGREKNRLRDYLVSPYFHPVPELIRFYEVLNDDFFYPGIMTPEREAVWNSLFPKKPFDDLAFRTLSSQLLKRVEGFLQQESLSQNPLQEERLLLEELNRRRQDKHLRYVLNRTRKTLDEEKLRDGQHHFDRYSLEMAQHRFNARQDFRSQKLAPVAALAALDAYYLASRLRLACEILNLKHILQVDEEVAMMDELEGLIAHGDYAQQPAVALYGAILRMLRGKEPESAYRELRHWMEHGALLLSHEEQYEVYIHAINFCIRQANRGTAEYLTELLGLYQEALERKVLLDQGQLSPSNYKNIVTVGLRVGDYRWVRKFIKKYKELLPASFRENAYTYNLAVYFYTVGEYEQVLKLLQEVDYDDVFYNLDSKVLLLKVYYETEESDALFSLFDSFSIFLRRNKVLSGYHKTINLNLIKFLKKLSNIPPGSAEKLQKLSLQIDATREISAIQWLREKVEEKRSRKSSRRKMVG